MNQFTPVSSMQLRLRFWTALIPIFIGLQLIYPSRVWVALFLGLGGAWVIAYVWARSLRQGLRLEREMRFGWAHVGDRLEERFTLINRSMVPALWVEVIDQSTLPDYDVSIVTAIGGNSHNSWKTSQVCNRRGVFTLGPTQILTGDPLGFFKVTIDLSGSAVLMITPPVVPLPPIEVVPGGRVGEGRRVRPDPLERTVSAGGVRKYQPGDPLRWIHWPLSMRQQELYVRNFDNTPASDWWIFLDLQASEQIGSGWNSTEEHGVVLAASLADRGLRQGHAVGFVAGGKSLVWLSPQGAGDRRMEILRALALIEPGSTSLAQLLETARPVFRRGASLIVITPSLKVDWLESLSFYIRAHLAPTILLFEPRSYGAETDVGPLQASLISLGIIPFVIRRDLLDRPEARPGHQGEWEWRVTGFGRAVPLRKPVDLSWHKVGG